MCAGLEESVIEDLSIINDVLEHYLCICVLLFTSEIFCSSGYNILKKNFLAFILEPPYQPSLAACLALPRCI